MALIPKEIVKSTRINPKSMVLFAKPKVGKTEMAASLPNSLLIDLEDGSDYVNAMKVNVIDIARKEGKQPLQVIQELIAEIKQANHDKKGYAFKYGILDTVTAAEEMVLPLARDLYMNTPQGRNFQGHDVRVLPNGAGYQYTREALWMFINMFKELFETVIILGHLKDKLIEKDGKEMNERGLDLAGKSGPLLCSQVDAIGYVYRDADGDTAINFKPSESITCGSRSEHLKDQDNVKIITKNEDGSLKIDWSKVFIEQ